MRDRVREDVDGLIIEYGLHQGFHPVVDLTPMTERYPVRWYDMREMGLRGLILPPAGGWPAHEWNRASVYLCKSMEHDGCTESRLVYAHEIGHGIAGHAGTMATGDHNLIRLDEREAWKIAARLLIPGYLVSAIDDTALLAELCQVPEWLACLRTGRRPGAIYRQRHDSAAVG